ncbi:MAG: hypothetical protein KAG66_01210, partial [Methylococcales bacterium]|nr:hypothetical protein [Methylococcales bacterium]
TVADERLKIGAIEPGFIIKTDAGVRKSFFENLYLILCRLRILHFAFFLSTAVQKHGAKRRLLLMKD